MVTMRVMAAGYVNARTRRDLGLRGKKIVCGFRKIHQLYITAFTMKIARSQTHG
jgi:hypothetical protein